mmetsp:Transcript_24420/g.55702  ORF Transcript_24420/g.55702 Transcript_24420/m.55702 type:complete len:135 (-) Transcript_24420:67-471(-)
MSAAVIGRPISDRVGLIGARDELGAGGAPQHTVIHVGAGGDVARGSGSGSVGGLAGPGAGSFAARFSRTLSLFSTDSETGDPKKRARKSRASMRNSLLKDAVLGLTTTVAVGLGLAKAPQEAEEEAEGDRQAER